MSSNFITLSQPSIQDLAPYVPGKPIEEVERELGITDVITLASNESPWGPSEAAKQAAIAALENIHRYPDGSGYILKKKLAEHFQVPFENITLGNGSDNLVTLLIQAYANPTREVLISEYAFNNYKISARAHNVGVQITPLKNWQIDIEAMVAKVSNKTALIFIANPNNPTGTYISHDVMSYLLKNTPEHVLVVIDEAYFEYVTEKDYPNTQALQRHYPNLVILRTFSKVYGLAGLRVGYSFSHPEIAEILNRIRLPFNVSTPALAAATVALDEKAHIEKVVAHNTRARKTLIDAFMQLGITTLPTAANFVTLDLKKDTRSLYQALLERGIIVRPLHAYHLPHHLRVTVGLTEHNNRAIEAFRQLLSEKNDAS